MKAPFTLSSFLLYLWLVSSTITARAAEESDFNFLTQYENAALVEDGLSLAGNAASLSFSTLVNLGFWYGACLAPEFFPWLAQRFRPTSDETKEFKTLATRFCVQLAPMITSTELALAGHVSPWPVEQVWWQSLRIAGMGLVAYESYAKTRDMQMIPVAALMYLATQTIAMTLISTASTVFLRKTGNMDICFVSYDFFQYLVLSLLNGMIVGSIIYDMLSKRGLSHARTVSAVAISPFITAAVSVIASTSLLNMRAGIEAFAEPEATAAIAVGAAAGAKAVAAAAADTLARSRAGVMAESVAVDAIVIGTGVGAVAGIAAGTLAGTEAEAEAIALTVVLAAAGAGIIATVVTVGRIRELLILSNTWSVSGRSTISKVGYAMIPALACALINSLAGYVVHGQPMEESFSGAARVQWKKFYALPDYFFTLFN